MEEKREHIRYENTKVPDDRGFQIRFVTMAHNTPLHWHREMEILYILNGNAQVTLDGRSHYLGALDLMVIDSSQFHDVIYALPQTMGICIHVSKEYLKRYLPDIEQMRFSCSPQEVEASEQEAYMKLCGYMKDLTVLYFQQKSSYPLACSAVVLHIMAGLVDHFSQKLSQDMEVSSVDNFVRMEQIFQYVEEHYKEAISLQDAADMLGLNKEYFCRFFKHNTSMTFLQYVNQVRLNHIYHDLLHTEGSVQEIMERHGMYNAKVFYRMFKETYHCTPREMKKMAGDSVYLS